jgi:hypothetical protein
MSVEHGAADSVARQLQRASLVALLSLMAAGSIAFSLREVARGERALAAQSTRAARIVTYSLSPGEQLRVPIEPATDVLRVVMHALRASTLAPAPHAVRMTASIHGTAVTRTETLTFSAPGTQGRAKLEQADGVVGDPVAVNIDVRGVGVGELTLRLEALEGADGLQLRLYRRESISPNEALQRHGSLDAHKRERLARRAGQLDWTDLDETTRSALVSARWKKIGAVADAEHQPQFRVITLAPAPTPTAAIEVNQPLAVFELNRAAQAALLVAGPNTLVVRTREGRPTPLSATLRARDGAQRVVTGAGELTLNVAAGEQLGVELSSPMTETIALYATDASHVELPSTLTCYRTTAERRALVVAGASALVLRVTARLPVDRTLEAPSELALTLATDDAAGHTTRETRRANVTRSLFDRYTGWSAEYAPSERAVFYVLVPARGRVLLGPPTGMLDLSLAELDPDAPPRPAKTFAVAAERAPSDIDPVAWEGFVARRPTNAGAFDPLTAGTLRIARRFAALAPATLASALRIERSRAKGAIHRHRWLFEPASATLHFDVQAHQPALLRLRFYAEQPTQVEARIDLATPRRSAAGSATHITTARTLHIDGEVQASLLLGDDLAPGRHTLSFVADRPLFVHLPWTRSARRKPQASAWVLGDFAP